MSARSVVSPARLRRHIQSSCLIPRFSASAGWISSRSSGCQAVLAVRRSEEHTSELQSLMRISYAVFCLKKKRQKPNRPNICTTHNSPKDNKHQTKTRLNKDTTTLTIQH